MLMTDTQSIDRQLKGLERELEAARKDEAELARLHAEKAGELDGLRAEKSRDFSGMAQIEGQRAALETMLREVRAEIGSLEARARELEGQKVTQAAYERIGATAARVREIQDTLHAELLAFTDRMTADVQALMAHRREWSELRQSFITDANTLGTDLYIYRNTDKDKAAQRNFVAELEGRGVDLSALRVNPFGEQVGQQTALDVAYRVPFLPEGEVSYYAPTEERLQRLAVSFYREAVSTILQAEAAQRQQAARGEK